MRKLSLHQLSGYSTIMFATILVVAFFNRNTFSENLKVLTELTEDPVQSAVDLAAFEVSYNEEHFKVIPKYSYELYGLVVSYRLHDATGGIMLHALTKDHLNIADLCVVWGQSADPKLLNEFDFSNGQFSCQYGTKSQQAWNKFNNNQLSNNHVLAADEIVRDIIEDIKIGDQIKLKGWLAHYINPLGYERGTSTVRTDHGDGACETIFVNEVEILKPMSSWWRTLLSFSFGAMIISLFLYFKSPYEPHLK